MRLEFFISFRKYTAFRSGTKDHWPMDFLVSSAWTKLLPCASRCKALINLSLTFLLMLLCLELLMIGQFHPFSWRPQRSPIFIFLKDEAFDMFPRTKRLILLYNLYSCLRYKAVDSFLILINKSGKYLKLILPLPLRLSLVLHLDFPLEILSLLTDKIIIHQILSIKW